MFKIDLAIAGSGMITGLQALDERRRLGLPDEVTLRISASRTTGWFEATEEFARQHFPYTATECSADVPLSVLGASDVVLEDKVLHIREDLTDERAMELFAAYYVKEEASCSG